LDALGAGGSVLDIGCGGGAAGLALVPPATCLIGVDASPEMLANFSAATEHLDVASQAVLGRWPEVAGQAGLADVVVCHHVVYNVAALVPFVAALTDHARRAVVVELTESHPQSSLNPLWERFWGLSRPEQPTAQLFVEVVRELGPQPVVSRWERPVEKASAASADYVAFVRRRLCLSADRDAEVAAALASDPMPTARMVTVSWPGRFSSTT
jgi:SAM-dependent methyltransferase